MASRRGCRHTRAPKYSSSGSVISTHAPIRSRYWSRSIAAQAYGRPRPQRSGRPMSRLGCSMPPSTSTTLPVT